MPSAAKKSVRNPLAADLDHILDHTRGLWEGLRGCRLFLTGGTGFFGRWLLESLTWANDRLNLNARCTVLTRDPAQFARTASLLAAHPILDFVTGDVRDFAFPLGEYSHLIHAATSTTSKPTPEGLLDTFETIVQGTRHTLEFASQNGVRRFLFTSSGAVYGRQPPEETHVSEDYRGGFDFTNPRNAYAEGKRAAELLGVLFARQNGFDFLSARGFAFVGPYLPLDAHFAVGNFIRDGLAGGPIQVAGDGTPIRSYLYAADLAAWLWTILLCGESGRAYNVGSNDGMSIAELAQRIGAYFDCEVIIHKKASTSLPPERYLPSTQRAQNEMGLVVWVPFAEALAKTVSWHRTLTVTNSQNVSGAASNI